MTRKFAARRASVVTSIAFVAGIGTCIAVAFPPSVSAAAVAVANPSMESGWTSTSPPTCWQLGGVGAATATLTRSSTAHTGTYAAKLTVSGLVSPANRKLVIDQRAAGCAPHAIPGHRYTLSAWVQGSAAARLATYYHNVSGWHYWTQSTSFAARSTWAAMTYTTSGLPAGADALSFGPALTSNGFVLIDDVALVDQSAPAPAPTTASAPASGATSTAAAPTSSAPTAGGTTIAVATASQLTDALAAAAPGQTIVIADGTYTGNFTLRRSGTASAPIRITGTRRAILNGGSVLGGYGLHLDNANYVRIDGISITDAQKALVLDQSSNDTLTNLDLYHTGDEVLLLRNYSRHNVVSGNQVHDSGLTTKGYGEGIYVGLSSSNWSSTSQSRTGGGPDTSDGNTITGNHVYNTTAENVDIKEGTSGGVIAGNTFDATGLSGANYADSWVDIAGNGYTVHDNTGVNPGSALTDGYQTHVILAGWGNGNSFAANASTVNASGYAINIQLPSSGNVVYSDNTVSGAAKGLSNVAATPIVR